MNQRKYRIEIRISDMQYSDGSPMPPVLIYQVNRTVDYFETNHTAEYDSMMWREKEPEEPK